jgi:hypothetical protein
LLRANLPCKRIQLSAHGVDGAADIIGAVQMCHLIRPLAVKLRSILRVLALQVCCGTGPADALVCPSALVSMPTAGIEIEAIQCPEKASLWEISETAQCGDSI